jgi:periplasmic protein TonB
VDRLYLPILVSVAIHTGVLLFAGTLPATPKSQKTLIEMAVVEKKPPPPPPPPPPEEKKVEPEKPKPKLKPIEAPKKVEPPKPAEPEPPPEETPPPEPQKPSGFSVDMESTVTGGEGPAVRATEGGGNMFADPKSDAPPGPKETVRTPPPPGAGTTSGASGSGIVRPEFAISESERRPPYPEEARRNEVEGRVLLRVLVGADGTVQEVKLLKGIGFGCDEAAIAHAKRKFRFKPGMRNGIPQPMWLTIPITFDLET